MFLGDGLFLRFDVVRRHHLLGATLFVDGNEEGGREGAPTLGRGLQLDQTLGREGEVPLQHVFPGSS